MTNHLTRLDPFAGLGSLRRDLLDDGFSRGLRVSLPTTDVYTRNDKELVVEAHLPHCRDEDITVSVDNQTLVVQGERREREEDKRKKYVLRESSTSFYRSVDLPEQVKDQEIRATFDDGVLKVIVPLKELSSPKAIPITNGHKDNGDSDD